VTPARELVRQALAGRRGDRPLFAPRACAIAGEIEGLSPPELLADATKMANLLRELGRGSGLDVIWVASGSDPETEPGRFEVALEVARRLRAVLGEGSALGYCFRGPAALARAARGDVTQRQAGERLLEMVRRACEAAADVIMVEECGPEPEDGAGYVAALRPVASTARFFQTLPVLSAPAWAGVPAGLARSFVSCVSERSPERGLYALAVDVSSPTRRDTGGCVLVTTTAELTGRMPLAVARQAMSEMRALLAGG
jgi:hypothetical protein